MNGVRGAGRRALQRASRWATAAVVATGVVAVAAPAEAGADDELTVVAFEVEPFVVREGEVPGGFMYDVWEQVAAELGWDYEVVWIESLDDLGQLVERGRADVVVTPLSPTAGRESSLDFTAAIVSSGPAFGVHSRTDNPVTLLGALFSRDVLMLLVWSGVGMLVLGHLMWWVDRRNPESDFNESYLRGIWDGVWWATVTVTTVGYGDTSPKTSRGRIVAILAMVGSLFLVGAFVSSVTRALRSERAAQVVDGIDDLDGRAVAVVADSTYEMVLQEQGVDTVAYDTQLDAFVAAERGDVDIVVADRFAIEDVGDEYGLRVSGDVLYDEFFGFAMPDGSPRRDAVNGVLADLHEEGRIRRVIERWSD